MKLFHCTPCVNLESIFKRGICPIYSQVKEEVNWYCEIHMLKWAIEHVSERHDCEPEDVAVLEVLFRPEEVCNRGSGKWTCRHTIIWRRILSVGDGAIPA